MQQKFSLKLLPSEATDEAIVKKIISQSSGKKLREINGYHILKKSIDARAKTVWINLTVSAFINEPFKRRFHKQFNFKDHHSYTTSDIEKLNRFAKEFPGVSILTTEKDKVKLEAKEFERYNRSLPLFYLPIEIEFIKNGQDFDEIVLNSIKRAG